MATHPFDILLDQVRQKAFEGARAGTEAAIKALSEKAAAPSPHALAASTAPPPAKKWYRAAELAKMFDLPQTFFEEKGREGKIRRSKPGRYVLFEYASVEHFIGAHAAAPGAENGKDH